MFTNRALILLGNSGSLIHFRKYWLELDSLYEPLKLKLWFLGGLNRISHYKKI